MSFQFLGEWWTSLDAGEKSKFNNLASEYKEHLMREQPNFSYNKKQNNPVQQVQSASTSNSSSNSVKSRSENFVPVIKVPSYESGSKLLEKQMSEQQDGHGHIVQLQQRSGNEEGSKNIKVITINSFDEFYERIIFNCIMYFYLFYQLLILIT